MSISTEKNQPPPAADLETAPLPADNPETEALAREPWLLRQTRHVIAHLSGAFRVLREDSFQSRSAQRAQAVQQRRRLVHKAGAPVSETSDTGH